LGTCISNEKGIFNLAAKYFSYLAYAADMAEYIDPFDIPALEKSVNDSAVRVSTIWVSFLVFGLYLAVAAGTVTHHQLFVEDPVRLPTINVELPLIAFFLLAPLIFVLFHLYILLQVLLLARTASAYNDALANTVKVASDRALIRQRLANTLFAQILAGSPFEQEGLIALIWPVVLNGKLNISIKHTINHPSLILWVALFLTISLVALTFPGEVSAKYFRMAAGATTSDNCKQTPIERIFGNTFNRLTLHWENVTDRNKLVSITTGGPLYNGEPMKVFRERDFTCANFTDGDFRYSDFRRAKLTGAILHGSKLEGVWLDEANLEGANLKDTNLQNAHLIRAHLESAYVQGALFQNAILDNAFLQGLSTSAPTSVGIEANDSRLPRATTDKVNFSKASLIEANLEGANLAGAELVGARLNNANLQNSHLEAANLTGASLIAARMDLAGLEKADLRGAILEGARLYKAVLNDAKMHNADLTRAILQEARLEKSDLSGAKIAAANLRKAILRGAQLPGLTLDYVDLEQADLARANLDKASLIETRLTGASLTGARLTAADLSRANLKGADLDEALLENAKFSWAYMQAAKLNGSKLIATIFNGAQLQAASFLRVQAQGASFSGADLRGAVFAEASLDRSTFEGSQLRYATIANATLWGASGATCDDAQVLRPTFDPVAGLLPKMSPNPSELKRDEQNWRGCADRAPPADKHDEGLTTFLFELACSREVDQAHVTQAIVINLDNTVHRKELNKRLLAKGLLDEAKCPGARGLPDSTKCRLRELVGIERCAWTRPIPDLTVDAAGTCPRQADLIGLGSGGSTDSARELISRAAVPSRSRLSLYRDRTLSEPVAQGATLSFDDDLELLAGAPLGQAGGGPALVRRIRDPLCGWVNVSDLEQFTQPMLLRDVPGFQNEVDRAGGASRLEARVIVKNRVNIKSGFAQRAPLFNEPFVGDVEPPEAQSRGAIEQFEVLSVFDIKRATGQACRSFRDPDCFLRVGSSSTQGLVRTRGWMRGSDVEFWPSPLAIYYAPGKQGLKIHLTEQSARIGTPFATPAAQESILAYQPEGRFEEPRQRNIMRFPIIRGTRLPEPATPVSGSMTATVPASYAYEILFTGQACAENIPGGDCIPEPQIKDEVARLGQAVRAISNIDVMFVVAATESMGPYLQSIVQALRRQVEKATASRQWSFRYSVVVYGDYNRTREGGLDYYALPFSSDLSGLDPLQRIGTYQDENRDFPEAPFAALERAASHAAWRVEAANRLIIWIGDHGNRDVGKHRTAVGELIETKTAQSVVDAIKERDARLRENTRATGAGTKTHFLAIQLRTGTSTPASEQSSLKFRQDAEAIRRGLGETTFSTIQAAVNRSSDRDQSALVNSISSQIDLIFNAVAEARQVAGALGGDSTGISGNLAPPALLGREFLSQLGFSPEQLREVGRRIQIVRNGFVFQSARNPEYRYWLGLRQPEFSDVLEKTRQLCENLRYSDRVNAVESSILALVRAVTLSEIRPNETVRDFYTRVFSVPVNTISPMLGEGTPADFVRTWRGLSHTQQEQAVAGVCKKAHLLQYAAEGQVVEEVDLVFEDNAVKLRSGATARDFDWRWFSPEARTVWFFIPLEFLP
jgi:uncharacterized protein YjbI with pentapeptide repeats